MMRKTFLRSIALAAGIALLFAAPVPRALAADGSWNVNNNGNWSTAGSWLGNTIPGATSGSTSADIATFGFTLSAARTVTVDTNRNIGGITFSNTSAFGYTLSSGNLLLTNGGVIQTAAANGAHTDTISSAIAIQGNGGSATFTAGGTNASSLLSIGAVTGVSAASNTTTLTLNGGNTGVNAITGIIGDGSGGGRLAIVKSGTGQWVLSGTNTFTGGVTINSGTLTVTSAIGNGGVAGSLGQATSDAANLVINGGVLNWNAAAAETTNRSLTIGTSGGTIISNNTGNNGLTLTGSLALAGSGPRTITLTSVSANRANSWSANIGDSGGVTVGAGSRLNVEASGTFSQDVTNNGILGTTTLQNGTITWSGVISGSGEFRDAGGNTTILSGTNNSYTGRTSNSGNASSYSLRVFKLADGGLNSSIGASSSAAANLNLGINAPSSATQTLDYRGTGDSTDRLFTATSNGGTVIVANK